MARRMVIDKTALHAIAERMHLYGGTPRVTLTRYPRSGLAGRYVGVTKQGRHRVSLSRDLEVGEADLVLCHELGHAWQCQELGGLAAFLKRWWAEAREAGLTRADVQSGAANSYAYRSMPLEREAWDIAHDFYPFCEDKGFIVCWADEHGRPS